MIALRYTFKISIRSFAGILSMFCLLLTSMDLQAQTDDGLTPLLRTVDIDLGENAKVELHDGSVAQVELLSVDPVTDPVMDAVRSVNVTVRVNGEEKTIRSGNYNLPVNAGGVQIDCPVTRDYMERASSDWWGLEKDARLRLWPAGSPYVWPGTFVYPVNQKWMGSLTQFSNEPVFGSPRANGEIYYHAGLDIGGTEDMVEIYAATDGVIVSVGDEVLEGEAAGSLADRSSPISPRYDVVYIRDARGWYYRYSHLDSIQPGLEVGQRVLAGQKLGMLGKEGGSGGWAHLHFEIVSRQPSGAWGTQEGYAFLWQAYRRQYDPELMAVARPHKAIYAGDTVQLSAGNTWSKNTIQSYEWILSDGSTRTGEEIEIRYQEPGMHSEIVKVTDSNGNYEYDFAVTMVFKPGSGSAEGVPRIHATYFPTMDIKAESFFQRPGPGSDRRVRHLEF